MEGNESKHSLEHSRRLKLAAAPPKAHLAIRLEMGWGWGMPRGWGLITKIVAHALCVMRSPSD